MLQSFSVETSFDRHQTTVNIVNNMDLDVVELDSSKERGANHSGEGWKTRLDSTESFRSSNEEELTRPSTVEKTKSGWYPGKYLGRKPPEKKLNVQEDEHEGTKQDIADRKQEAMIVKTVRSIRNKYLERQLVGKIYIYRISGVIATAITVEVTREDIMHHFLQKAETGGVEAIIHDDPLMQAELEGKYKRALSTTDTILNSLERRSLAWEGCDFGANTLLTRGSTIGVSDPFIGMMALSFTLELSATAHSLLASRKRYEATRELAACRPSMRASDVGDAKKDAALAAKAVSAAKSGDRTASDETPATTLEKKTSGGGFFGFGSSHGKEKKGTLPAGQAEDDDYTVDITEIYGEPVHSLDEQPVPKLK